MSKQQIAFRRIQTSAARADLLKATEDALRRVGGVLMTTGETISIQGGNAGVSTSFASDIQATAVVREKSPGEYEVTCTISTSPNAIFWVCAVVGLCIWPLWIVNVFHFMVDPLPTYQRALDQIELPAAPK